MSTSSQPTMVFEGLRCQHGVRILLEIPRLALSVGYTIVITGANGVSKATLLRMLAGLAPAHSTTVDLGRRQQVLPPYLAELRAQLTYVYQHPYLFHTSVHANLAYGLIMGAHCAACTGLNVRVGDALRQASLQHVVDVPPERLSGGETQHLALVWARALHTDVLLLDKPTSNLDDTTREQVTALVGGLTAEGHALLIACHGHELINLSGVTHWKLERVGGQGRLEIHGHRAAQGTTYDDGLSVGDIRAGEQALLQRLAQPRRSVFQQYGAHHPRQDPR